MSMTALDFIKYSGLTGVFTFLLTFLSVFAAVAMFVVSRRREPFAAILFAAVAILLVGIFGGLWGLLGAFNTIATSATPPTPAQLSGGFLQSLCAPMQAIPEALLVGFLGIVGYVVKPSDGALAAKELEELIVSD